MAGRGARYIRTIRKADRNQKEITDALAAVGVRVFDLSGVGKGCPDLVAWNGRDIVLLEVKTETGGLKPSQKATHRDWPIVTVRTIEDALIAVGIGRSENA